MTTSTSRNGTTSTPRPTGAGTRFEPHPPQGAAANPSTLAAQAEDADPGDSTATPAEIGHGSGGSRTTRGRQPAARGGKRPSGALLEERTRKAQVLLSQGVSVRQLATALGIPQRTAERLATRAKRAMAAASAGHADELRGAALERARLIAREARQRGALGVALQAEKFVADLLRLDSPSGPPGGQGAAQEEQRAPPGEEEVLDSLLHSTAILTRWIARESTFITRDLRDGIGNVHRAIEARYQAAEQREAARLPALPAPPTVHAVDLLHALDAAPRHAEPPAAPGPAAPAVTACAPPEAVVEVPCEVVPRPAPLPFDQWLRTRPLRG